MCVSVKVISSVSIMRPGNMSYACGNHENVLQLLGLHTLSKLVYCLVKISLLCIGQAKDSYLTSVLVPHVQWYGLLPLQIEKLLYGDDKMNRETNLCYAVCVGSISRVEALIQEGVGKKYMPIHTLIQIGQNIQTLKKVLWITYSSLR